MSSSNSDKRKPMARVQRIPLFRREIHEHLNVAAFELLLAGARILSEGELTYQKDVGPMYYGSTMVTLDLERSAAYLRGQLDASMAEKLLALCSSHEQVRERLLEVARREASRLAGRDLGNWDIELKARRKGASVLVSLDVEAKAAQTSLFGQAS